MLKLIYKYQRDRPIAVVWKVGPAGVVHGSFTDVELREFPAAESELAITAVEDEGKTRPSRPIRCDVWIVEQMRYPTNQLTDRPTNGHSQLWRCFVTPNKANPYKSRAGHKWLDDFK